MVDWHFASKVLACKWKLQSLVFGLSIRSLDALLHRRSHRPSLPTVARLAGKAIVRTPRPASITLLRNASTRVPRWFLSAPSEENPPERRERYYYYYYYRCCGRAHRVAADFIPTIVRTTGTGLDRSAINYFRCPIAATAAGVWGTETIDSQRWQRFGLTAGYRRESGKSDLSWQSVRLDA